MHSKTKRIWTLARFWCLPENAEQCLLLLQVGLGARGTDSAKPSGSQRVVYTNPCNGLLPHTAPLLSIEPPTLLPSQLIPAFFMSRLCSIIWPHTTTPKIHEVEKNASKPAWLVVIKWLQGSSTPRVSLGFHMCVSRLVTMPLLSVRTGLSLWTVAAVRLLSHFLWLLYFISHNHKHMQSPETALYIH